MTNPSRETNQMMEQLKNSNTTKCRYLSLSYISKYLSWLCESLVTGTVHWKITIFWSKSSCLLLLLRAYSLAISTILLTNLSHGVVVEVSLTNVTWDRFWRRAVIWLKLPWSCKKSDDQFDFTNHRRFSPGISVCFCSITGPIRGGLYWTSWDDSLGRADKIIQYEIKTLLFFLLSIQGCVLQKQKRTERKKTSWREGVSCKLFGYKSRGSYNCYLCNVV